jgi:hypothetical protein
LECGSKLPHSKGFASFDKNYAALIAAIVRVLTKHLLLFQEYLRHKYIKFIVCMAKFFHLFDGYFTERTEFCTLLRLVKKSQSSLRNFHIWLGGIGGTAIIPRLCFMK